MASSNELEVSYQRWNAANVADNDEQQLLDLLLLQARTQIRRVVTKVSAGVASRLERSDLEDVCGNAMLTFYRMLLRWRGEKSAERPQVLKPYVNQVARNAFHDLMRQRHPSWFSMAGKVLWKLRHRNQFVVLEQDDRKLCALPHTARNDPETDLKQMEAAMATMRREKDWGREALEDLLEALLTTVDRPVPFDALVGLCVQCSGGERSTRSLSEEIGPDLWLGDTLADDAPDPEQQAREAEVLLWVWREMDELPQQQRQVCGLNLEAAVGTRLEIFVLRGVANKSKYEILIRPLLMDRLPGFPPFPDPQIAQLLETDVKRVSNYRVSSQRRLARRYSQGY